MVVDETTDATHATDAPDLVEDAEVPEFIADVSARDDIKVPVTKAITIEAIPEPPTTVENAQSDFEPPQPTEKQKKSRLGNLFGKNQAPVADQPETDQRHQDSPLDLDINEINEPILIEDPALDDLSEEDLIEQAIPAHQEPDMTPSGSDPVTPFERRHANN
ncbi:unnamed protein product [Darwinula stevensoni]|uniref:Uncharacterized protein n=1 Tax=Darwinula stevensoni TaxID=69355 RepID=A0A7R9FSP9_9CRUS|nr:unnamed protein product [Darwinula stevensoni]CAG0903074.1 unnamed protein product [Darwinula stevensoni]